MADAPDDALELATDLGDGVLDIVSLNGREVLSSPFHFEIETRVTEPDADVPSLLGSAVCATLIGGDDVERSVHGVVHGIWRDGPDCVLTVQPWLALLQHSSNNRIFQAQSVVDIVTTIFDAGGFSDYRFATTSDPAARDYCVQFGETDFDFVSRLLEEEGLGYFFEHTDSAHTMVIFDDVSACDAMVDDPVPLLPLPPAAEREEDVRIQALAVQLAVGPGKFDTRDYNYETPSTSLNVTIGDGESGHYVYPGRFGTLDDGEAIANKRLAAHEQDQGLITGTSPLRLFCAGYTFTLSNHDDDDLNIEYLVRSVSHEANDQVGYACTFHAQPTQTAYRPLQRTPRPMMPGPQTAVVVGRSGEPLWTDEYGRIKVQFHWDREGTNDENSSCWLRVAQPIAGAGWGIQVLPRVGQEVVVSFIDGNPDRPLVTGVVYNGENATPYDLPADQTKSTFKSNSDDDSGGFNELRFEDKAGSEEVYLHAQLDMLIEIENDRTTTVGNNETLTVTEGDRTITVEQGNEVHSVAGTRDLTVSGDETRKNEGAFTQITDGDTSITISGALSISVSGDIEIASDGNITLSAGGSLTLEAGGALDASAGTSFTLTGSASGEVDGGGTLTVKGGMVQIN